MNWLDILFVLIIGWYTWTGFMGGLVGGITRLLGMLAGLAAAFNFYRPLADIVNLKWNLVSVIGDWMPLAVKNLPDPKEILYPLKSLPGTAGPLPGQEGALRGLQGIGESAVHMLATGILEILCFVVIFLVVSKAVGILGAMLGKMAKIMFLGPLDRAGGALLGAAKGVIIAAVLVALLRSFQLPAAFFPGAFKASWAGLALQKSVLAPYFVRALDILNIHFFGWNI